MKKFTIDYAGITYNALDPRDDRGYTVFFFGRIEPYEIFTHQLASAYIPHKEINPLTMFPYFGISYVPIELAPEDLTQEAQIILDSWAGANIFTPGNDLYMELSERAEILKEEHKEAR